MEGIPIIKMIFESGPMGQFIVGLLLLLSLWSWALIFMRLGALNGITAGNKRFRQRFLDVRHLSEVDKISTGEINTPMGQLARVGSAEYSRILSDVRSHTGVRDLSFFLESQFTMAKEHIESALTGLIAPFGHGVFYLAMISSIAPFLGLLGTVWGIMNSFYDISNEGSASLPVVAPGIAAALITTIVGLAVAIPALFFYNLCSNRAERAEDDMEEFKEVLTVRLKREIFSAFFAQEQQQQAQQQRPQYAPPAQGGYR